MTLSNFEALSRRLSRRIRNFPVVHLNPNNSINLEHREIKQKYSYIKIEV